MNKASYRAVFMIASLTFSLGFVRAACADDYDTASHAAQAPACPATAQAACNQTYAQCSQAVPGNEFDCCQTWKRCMTTLRCDVGYYECKK